MQFRGATNHVGYHSRFAGVNEGDSGRDGPTVLIARIATIAKECQHCVRLFNSGNVWQFRRFWQSDVTFGHCKPSGIAILSAYICPRISFAWSASRPSGNATASATAGSAKAFTRSACARTASTTANPAGKLATWKRSIMHENRSGDRRDGVI